MYTMVKRHAINLDDASSVETELSISSKHSGAPDIAIFDTFVAEEKFSHHIHRRYPNCLKVLDLQDLHSLRRLRESIVMEHDAKLKKASGGGDYEQVQGNNQMARTLSPTLEAEVLRAFPNSENSDIFSRELASMLRSDVVISCSDYECERLKNQYKLSNVELLTFFYDMSEKEDTLSKQMQSFSSRQHFVWIGNQTHAPNVDSLRVLLQDIWPRIAAHLPEAELHIYGSNYQKEFSGLERLGLRIRSCGLMDSINRLARYRVMLAPMRFGAGIKGKVADAWLNHLPVVTNRVAAEGMFYYSAQEKNYGTLDTKTQYFKDAIKAPSEEALQAQQRVRQYYATYDSQKDSQNIEDFGFGGFCNNTADGEAFAEAAVRLYTDQSLWQAKAQLGFDILQRRFGFPRNDTLARLSFGERQTMIQQNRKNNFLYGVTWSETLRSTENLAKFIKEKNKNLTAHNQTQPAKDNVPKGDLPQEPKKEAHKKRKRSQRQ